MAAHQTSPAGRGSLSSKSTEPADGPLLPPATQFCCQSAAGATGILCFSSRERRRFDHDIHRAVGCAANYHARAEHTAGNFASRIG